MNGEYFNEGNPSQDHSSAPRAVVRELSTYMTDADSEKFCRLFADGLRSGVGYARIFDFMERQKLDSKMTARLRVAVLEKGDKLGEAFARFGILDAPTRKLVLVGEEQGALPDTFREQAKMFGERVRRKKMVVVAFVELVLFLCLGLFFLRNVLGVVIELATSPDWGPLFPALMKSGIQSTIFFLFYGGIAYLWVNLPADSSFREAAGRVWFRMPLFSQPSRLQSTSNLARYFRQSVRSGMDIFRSLELSVEATNNPAYMETLDKSFSALEEGYPLDVAFRQLKTLPEEFSDYVGIGEETGRLDENLQFLGDRYATLAQEAFERLMAAVMYFARFSFIILIMIYVVFAGVLQFAQIDLF